MGDERGVRASSYAACDPLIHMACTRLFVDRRGDGMESVRLRCRVLAQGPRGDARVERTLRKE